MQTKRLPKLNMKWNIIKSCIKLVLISYYLKQIVIQLLKGKVLIYFNVSDFKFNTIIISLYFSRENFRFWAKYRIIWLEVT